MQPYQEASQETQRQSEIPIDIFKSVAKTAIGYGGGIALSKVAPFLSKYIPENIMVKGLSKLDPRFGKFIDKALSNGTSLEEVKSFISEKMEGQEDSQKQEPPKENRNIIQQYSPELYQFIDEQIKNGRDPLQAGAIAQNDKRFSSIINKLSKDHKTPWSNILQSVYGQSQKPQQQNSQQQSGQGQAALMAILQKLQQSRGGQ